MKIINTYNCYKNCIEKNALMPDAIVAEAKDILSQLPVKLKLGRPSLDQERMLQGIYYLLKNGIPWKALPRCFGSASAIHRFFQKLVRVGFFKILWTMEIEKYDQIHGLNLSMQAMDSSHRKSPLGNQKTGNNPVDRRKQGTKLSVLSERNGIILGMAVGASNQHDSKLFFETLESVTTSIQQPYYKEMYLDSAYDSEEIKTILFNRYYVPKIAPNQRRRRVKRSNPLGYCRWFIEPVHSWMNRFRSIFVRYCKYAANYLALAQFAVAAIISNKIRI